MRILLIIVLAGGVYSALAQAPADRSGKARDLVAQHRYEAALAYFDGHPQEASSTEMMNLIGYCYAKLGRYREAVRSYEKALHLDSANTTSLNRLADLYKGREEFLKAYHFYSKLGEADSLNSYFYKQRGYCLYKAGLILASIPLYEQALRLNPDDEDVILALAGIHFEQKHFFSCDSLLNRNLITDTSGTRILSLKARSKYYQKQYDSTLAVLEAVFLRGDTGLVNIRLVGNAFYARDKYQESISWFERIPAELREQDEYIQYMMGVSYRHLDSLAKSINHLKKAIDIGISGNISSYYQQLGLSHEENGEMSRAVAAFETAGHYKEEGIVYYQIARIHDYYKDDPTTALEYYKRYLATGDSSVQKAWEFSRRRVAQLE